MNCTARGVMSRRCSRGFARRRWSRTPSRPPSSNRSSPEMDEFLTIAEASRLIGARKLSPVELTRHCLSRISRLNPILHCFLTVTEERAMADARAAESRHMSRAARGKLDGIPIAHKDIYCTAGIATTAHSKHLINYVPAADATVV